MNGLVTVIGGANLDINGFSRKPLIAADSNPGRVEYCAGGVGRNIAENLHRLGVQVRLISVIGDDPGGELIKGSSARAGLNIEHSLFLKTEGNVTSVYIALMDSNGEMNLALADMDIMELMTKEHLESKAGIIEESEIVLLDANLSEGIITYILDRFGRHSDAQNGHHSDAHSGGKGPRFFLDAVSGGKARRAASRIGSFDTLKLGRMEAAALSGISLSGCAIAGDEAARELGKAADWFCDRGVRRAFITLGKEGVFTLLPGRRFFTPVRYAPPLNTSGGGDAFMAGIVYGTLEGWNEEKMVSFSMAMARITVRSKYTVSREMSLELAFKEMEQS